MLAILVAGQLGPDEDEPAVPSVNFDLWADSRGYLELEFWSENLRLEQVLALAERITNTTGCRMSRAQRDAELITSAAGRRTAQSGIRRREKRFAFDTPG